MKIWALDILLRKICLQILSWKGTGITVQKRIMGDFPGGPVGKTVLPVQGAWVRFLVGELDPAYMPQLRSPHATTKSPHAATKKPACRN